MAILEMKRTHWKTEYMIAILNYKQGNLISTKSTKLWNRIKILNSKLPNIVLENNVEMTKL